jgi:hypothetical protein
VEPSVASTYADVTRGRRRIGDGRSPGFDDGGLGRFDIAPTDASNSALLSLLAGAEVQANVDDEPEQRHAASRRERIRGGRGEDLEYGCNKGRVLWWKGQVGDDVRVLQAGGNMLSSLLWEREDAPFGTACERA